MSGAPNLLPGPLQLPGGAGIASPTAAGGIPIPTTTPVAANNAAVVNQPDQFLIHRQANGGTLTGVPPGAATAATPPVGGQGTVQFLVPPSTGGTQIATGATPVQQIHSPMAMNNGGNGVANGQQQQGQYIASGIKRAIIAVKDTIHDHAKIRGELAWQPSATDTTTRTAFKTQVLSQLDFRCMGHMRPKSNHIQVVHSMANFFVPGGSAEFQNKDFGFLGDSSGFMTFSGWENIQRKHPVR